MRKSAPTLLLAALSLGAYAPAPLPKPPEVKNAPFGTWTPVSMGQGKELRPHPNASTTKVVISKDRWTVTRNDMKTIEYAIVVNAKARPATLDLNRMGTGTPMFRGIYRIEGDVLHLRYYPIRPGEERPKALEGEDPNAMVLTMRRDKR